MQSLSTQTLFRPFELKSLTLKNRIVMAPMTRTFSPNGVPGKDVAAYYRRRAEGDVGLILSEGTVVERPVSRNNPQIPFFYGEAALKGWKNVISEVHAAGGKMGPQIWHVGPVRDPGTTWKAEGPVDSPSGLTSPGKSFTEPMSEEAIADTIAAFAKAAKSAKDLGFDIVEIHGAHGYLIDLFFWEQTNLRTDQYGGATLKERSKLASQVIEAVRAAVGPQTPISLRVSQWKQQDYDARLAVSPNEMEDWLAPLVDAGADILHCSQRRFWEPEFPEIDGEDGLNFAGWAKKLTGAKTISVGSVGLDNEFLTVYSGQSSGPSNFDNLIQRMEKDEFDLIAVGRAILNDPLWVEKIRDGKTDELRAFDPATLKELF